MPTVEIGIFHMLALLESIFALYTFHTKIEPFLEVSYGGNWKFLTYINLNSQLICFTLCVLCDIAEYLKFINTSAKIKQVKQLFFASISLPICLIVFVSFWTLYIIDRELIYPESFDSYFPWWTNHLLHSVIIITVLEVACDDRYPRRGLGLFVCSLTGLGYIAWIFFIYRQSGIWVYPVFAKLKGVYLGMFLMMEVVLLWLIYFLGESLNNMACRRQSARKVTKKKN